MEVNEVNKRLSKFYVSVRREDGTYYKRNSLFSVRGSRFVRLVFHWRFHWRFSFFGRSFCLGISIITWVIILKQLFASGAWILVDIPLDFVSGNIYQYSLRLRRIIVKYQPPTQIVFSLVTRWRGMREESKERLRMLVPFQPLSRIFLNLIGC